MDVRKKKEVDVVLGEVACSKIEGPPFLCKVRATNHCATSPSIASPHAKAKVPLLKPRWSEEKERWMLRFVKQLVPK